MVDTVCVLDLGDHVSGGGLEVSSQSVGLSVGACSQEVDTSLPDTISPNMAILASTY